MRLQTERESAVKCHWGSSTEKAKVRSRRCLAFIRIHMTAAMRYFLSHAASGVPPLLLITRSHCTPEPGTVIRGSGQEDVDPSTQQWNISGFS